MRSRVMPCLLLADDGLVKTIKFKDPTYIGDPVNVINIFNQCDVDEVVLLDISATVEKRSPPFKMIERIANECTAPLAVGGGIRSLEDIRRLMWIGVEKVIINSYAALEPEFVSAAAATFGSQAVVVSIDVKKPLWGDYRVFIESGKRGLRLGPGEHAAEMQARGAGEILITSIDRDGTMSGYDLDLIARVTKVVSIPVIACGGAGTRKQLADPVKIANAAAVAAGSLFVYQGAERGVLINLPTRRELDGIFMGTGGSFEK